MKRINFIALILITAMQTLFAGDYSLEEYVKLVEENSKDLSLARFDKKLAENKKDQASSAVRPMITGSIGYTRNLLEISSPYPVGSGTTVNPATGLYPAVYSDVVINSDNDYSMSLGLQQTLFDLKAFKAIEASEKYITLTGSVFEATRQAIITGAKKIYFQAVLLEEVYLVKKSTEENAYETWKDTQLKFENDLTSELDVLQAEVNWQINVPETTLAMRNRDLALSNLKHMAGIDFNEDLVLTDGLVMIENPPEEVSLGEILGSRPDFQALKIGNQLNEINISAKKSEFFPKLTATAGWGWKASDNGLDLSDGTNAMQVGLELSVPIYYGGLRFSQLEEARINAEKAELEMLKMHDEIQMEINNLDLLLSESMDRIQSAESTLNTAEKAYAIMVVTSRNGMATSLDLKDALLNLEGSRLNYYVAIFDYLDAFFSWQQAVGEGDLLPQF